MAILFGDLTGMFRLVNAREWILWSAHQIVSRILSILACEMNGSLLLKQKFVSSTKSGGKKWGIRENKIGKTIWWADHKINWLISK